MRARGLILGDRSPSQTRLTCHGSPPVACGGGVGPVGRLSACHLLNLGRASTFRTRPDRLARIALKLAIDEGSYVCQTEEALASDLEGRDVVALLADHVADGLRMLARDLTDLLDGQGRRILAAQKIKKRWGAEAHGLTSCARRPLAATA